MGLMVIFPDMVDCHISHKIPVFRYPICLVNGMLHCNESHDLLMKCFKAFLRRLMRMEDAFDSTYLALIDLNMTSSTKVESQIADKILDFGYPRSMADEMLY